MKLSDDSVLSSVSGGSVSAVLARSDQAVFPSLCAPFVSELMYNWSFYPDRCRRSRVRARARARAGDNTEHTLIIITPDIDDGKLLCTAAHNSVLEKNIFQ